MITCLKCGHTELSVASTCPNCSRRLTPDPIAAAGGLNDLVECPRCSKLLDRRTPTCRHCGYAARRARRVRRAAVIAAGVTVVAVIWGISFKAPPPDETAARAAPTPEEPAGPLEEMMIARAPPDTTPTDLPAARPGPAPPPEPPEPIPPARWTNNWVNVREDRSVNAPVVRILRPGTRVEIGDRARGWWAVSIEGVPVGYVSSELLDTAPPAPSDSAPLGATFFLPRL